MLKIWGRKTSSNVQKVLWCCGELDIPFERVDIGGPFGGNQDTEYLALNPNGLVPTIQDGDLILWESNTICRYLAATRHGERLYPSAPAARALGRTLDGLAALDDRAADGRAAVRIDSLQTRAARPCRDRGGAAQSGGRLDDRRGRARRRPLSRGCAN